MSKETIECPELKTRTVFKCKKCGFVQDIKDKNGEYKEWQYHCGTICTMTALRSINLNP